MKLSNIKRFWISFILSIPMLIQMFAMPFHWMMPGYNWIAFITTTIIMAISAAPYWSSAWAAFKHHSANMNTLVAVGTAVAYFYSIFAMFTGHEVYFESAAFVTVFVLLGDAMEEKMHNNASNALAKLIDLQAKDAEVERNGEFVKVPLDQVKVGDIIRVKPGEKVPVEVLHMLNTEKDDYSLVALLNANHADGIDTSWIWDADFEGLDCSKIKKVLVGGQRWHDMGFRLEIAGFDPGAMNINPDDDSLIEEIKKLPTKKVYILSTYTAMLALRKTMAEKKIIKAGM